MARGMGKIHGRAHHQAVGLLNFGDDGINGIVPKDALVVQLATCATADAISHRTIAQMDDFAGDALLG